MSGIVIDLLGLSKKLTVGEKKKLMAQFLQGGVCVGIIGAKLLLKVSIL